MIKNYNNYPQTAVKQIFVIRKYPVAQQLTVGIENDPDGLW